jgi:asparagine synthase (glutamine-hydrolysing)
MLLPNDMLTKVDSMSMANSLEVRVPFLDHEIVDFAMNLPDSFKINEHSQKRILQDTFRNDLPDELYNRSKKGFEVPLLKLVSQRSFLANI